MATDDVDVVIIGAGPVGGRVATLLSQEGLDVLMVEEHQEIGRPFQCAGLVTPSAMHAVEAYDTVLEEIDGALIHGPSGTLVPVGTEEHLRTYVVCRKRFDQRIVHQAMQSGAKLLLNAQPYEAEINEDGVVVHVQHENQKVVIRAKLIIGCDGAHSWTRRYFKMGHPKELMIGFQTEVTGYESRARWLEMYSGQTISPGFFAWVIPSGYGTHRIGVWSTAQRLNGKPIEEYYESLIQHPRWKERFSTVQTISKYCGPVPSGMVKRPVKERVMLIGDAAGMAKPTTGGGIGPGFHQIQCIYRQLSELVKANTLSEKELKKLIKQPWEKMRKEQDRARALRNLLVSDRTDDELDHHFRTFAKPDTLALINKIGDIEKPVPLGMALLKNVPEFRSLALKAGVKLLLT